MNRPFYCLRFPSNPALLVAAWLTAILSAWAAAVSAPTPQTLQAQAERCRRILDKSIVEFYLPACVDQTNGGYLEHWKEGRFISNNEKFLTLQARQLWFFSTLAQENIQPTQTLAAAQAGYSFLEDRMRDRLHGGYSSKVTDSGQPLDPRKHVYLNSFALYGLVAYHRATRHAPALNAARDLFNLLEERAWDRQHGGYGEFFQPDWQPVTDPKSSGYVGAIGTKTYNTHLHLLESFAALYRAWPDPRLERRLRELIQINVQTVHHPDHNCNIDGWWPDWRPVDTPRNQRASYGHDVECVWLTLDAARTLGLSPSLFRSWAQALCEYSLRFGYDRAHGGFHYSGPLGRPSDDTKKEWWVQAEALVSMLEMFRLTGEPGYYQAFSQTLDFVEKHQVAPGGGWWATRAADGAPLSPSLSSPWQGAYHNGRAMLLCAQLLDQLGR